MRAAYHPEFKASFEAAVRHYEGIGRPLADRFKAEVKAGVKSVFSSTIDHAPGPHRFPGNRLYSTTRISTRNVLGVLTFTP